MAKKAVSLDGLLDTTAKPTATGIPQRGAENAAEAVAKPAKREGGKRLSVALDSETYKRLRLHAVEVEQSHQDILERAVKELLDRANA